jgi:hypothetical protein
MKNLRLILFSSRICRFLEWGCPDKLAVAVTGSDETMSRRDLEVLSNFGPKTI